MFQFYHIVSDHCTHLSEVIKNLYYNLYIKITLFTLKPFNIFLFLLISTITLRYLVYKNLVGAEEAMVMEAVRELEAASAAAREADIAKMPAMIPGIRDGYPKLGKKARELIVTSVEILINITKKCIDCCVNCLSSTDATTPPENTAPSPLALLVQYSEFMTDCPPELKVQKSIQFMHLHMPRNLWASNEEELNSHFSAAWSFQETLANIVQLHSPSEFQNYIDFTASIKTYNQITVSDSFYSSQHVRSVFDHFTDEITKIMFPPENVPQHTLTPKDFFNDFKSYIMHCPVEQIPNRSLAFVKDKVPSHMWATSEEDFKSQTSLLSTFQNQVINQFPYNDNKTFITPLLTAINTYNIFSSRDLPLDISSMEALFIEMSGHITDNVDAHMVKVSDYSAHTIYKAFEQYMDDHRNSDALVKKAMLFMQEQFPQDLLVKTNDDLYHPSSSINLFKDSLKTELVRSDNRVITRQAIFNATIITYNHALINNYLDNTVQLENFFFSVVQKEKASLQSTTIDL